MKLQDIEFATILASYTSHNENKPVLSSVEYFNHITSLLCEHPYYNVQFIPEDHHSVSGVIQVNKPGIFKSAPAPGCTVICLQFEAFYLHCMQELQGKFISSQYPSIIINLYHYGNELKIYGKLDEYKAIKNYLNMIYGMVDRGMYKIYESNYNCGSFMSDISSIGNRVLCGVAQLGNCLYMDTDYTILRVPDVAEFKQELYKYIPNYSWKIDELAQVAIVGKKQILAIDREFTYYPL